MGGRKLLTLMGWLLGILPSVAVVGQCVFDVNTELMEVDSLHFKFEVMGATMDDLSDPGQGVCRVCINFRHEYIGDLTAYLTSPAGQTVQLLGSEGNFGLTQFTEWDVCFVPISQPANPAPGFMDRWSNNQLWGAFAGIYTGEYYPYSGDLEDFNTGPVDGVWTLSFQDRTVFYVGELINLSMEFCSDQDVICNICNPGVMHLELEQDQWCYNDTLLLKLTKEFVPPPSDSLDYQSQCYILNDAQQVIAPYFSDTLLNFPPGEYQICGLMYQVDDSSSLPQISTYWKSYLSELNSRQVCITEGGCITFYIYPNGDTTFIDRPLCPGETLAIEGQLYDSTGHYIIPLVSQFGCDSIVDLLLEVVEYNLNYRVLDTLDCVTDSTYIVFDDFPSLSGLDVIWLGPNGSRLNVQRADSVQVKSAGKYTLILNYRSCSDTVVIPVVQDSSLPQVFIVGDTLNCNKDSAFLQCLTNVVNPVYTWIYENDTLPQMSSTITVGQLGNYKVLVTAENGCMTLQEYSLVRDTAPIEIQLMYDSLICQEDSVVLSIFSRDSIVFSRWRGPSGLGRQGNSITTFDTGMYYVTVIGQDGCVREDSIRVKKVKLPDEVLLASKPIQCQEAGWIRYEELGRPILNPIWTGPNGFLSADSSNRVGTSGVYVLTYESANGCLGREEVTVLDERMFPNINLDVDFLACVGDTAWARAHSDSMIVDIRWVTPSGDTIDSDSILTNYNGVFTVVVRGANGCETIDSVQVFAQNAPPVKANADTLNCFNGKVAHIWGTSSEIDMIYRWTHKGVFAGIDSVITVREGGWYHLAAESRLGCTIKDSIFVQVDTTRPRVLVLSPDTLSCRAQSVELISVVDPPLAIYEWVGPQGFTSGADRPVVFAPGQYTLTATAVNGCQDSAQVEVTIDTITPSFALTSDTINCSRTETTVRSDQVDDRWVWVWQAPDGLIHNGPQLTTQVPGAYTVTVTDTVNGCSKMWIHEVIIDTAKFQFHLPDTLIIGCGLQGVWAGIDPDGTVSQISWSDGQGIIGRDSVLYIENEGQYDVSVETRNGCTSMKSFFVQQRNLKATVEVNVPALNCRNQEGRFFFSREENVQDFSWILPDGRSSLKDTLWVSVAGRYQLLLRSTTGCLDTLDYLVDLDTVRPDFALITDGAILCEKKETILECIPTDTDQYQYLWMRMKDTIGQMPHLVVKDSGRYTLELTNLGNGCSRERSIYVADSGQVEINWDLDVVNPQCPGQANGQIRILELSEGHPEYDVYLNGIPYEAPYEWTHLRRGEYSITVVDEVGCARDTIISLLDGLSMVVDAGIDTTIRFGDTATLHGRFFVQDTSIDYIFQWKRDSFVLLVNQVEIEVQPEETTEYTFEVITDDGCTLYDRVIVYVKDDPLVFVPNVFTPNGDHVNDWLEVHWGSNVSEIVSFQVFDRWGEMPYSVYRVGAGDEIRWDGTLDGEPMLPGVFVYKMEVRTTGGRIFQRVGHFTLVK